MDNKMKKDEGGKRESKSHIRLDEKRFVETIKKTKRRFIPSSVETPMESHRNILAKKIESTANISKKRRRIYSDNEVYLKLSLTNNISASNQLLNKFGFKLLRVLEDKKAIVSFSDNDLNDISKNLETSDTDYYFGQVEDVEPLRTEDKLGESIKTILSKMKEDELIETKIEFFRNLDGEKYQSIIESINNYLSDSNGKIISKLLDKHYCRIEAKIKVSSINELASGIEPIENIDDINKFRVGISKIHKIDKILPDGESEKILTNDSNIVCVIDSGVQRDHFYLRNIIDDEAVDYTSSDPFVDNVGHGTFIAGLIAYGDLSHTPIPSPDIKIISAKIINSYQARIPNLEDKLTEIVQRFSPRTRIFNLSVNCEICTRISYLAEIIDRLERTYGVLFVISTGNLELTDIQTFMATGQSFPNYFNNPTTMILTPAEACNAITVGSITDKESPDSIAKKFNPSPFTRRGLTPDIRVKPDLIEIGGNLEFSTSPTPGIKINDALSIKSLAHNGIFRYDLGTSFSTALISRVAAHILKKYPLASINLVKALLINSSLIPKSTVHRNISSDRRLIGWGKPDSEFALSSNPNRVTYFLESEINTATEKIVKIRVPHEMKKIKGYKRMITTLVYNPPTDSSNYQYSKVDLNIRLWKAGTIKKREVKYKQDDGSIIIRHHNNWQRSGWGTENLYQKEWDNVRYGIFQWTKGINEWSGRDWEIHIIPKKRFLENDINQKFSLVVTLEDPTYNIGINLYESVCNELGISIEEKVRLRT